ncbi:MAG TPA: PAS domain S-box protein, partial [Longimicrobiaceae bacterium]|nr:PAS domain S-box protein [Longimicrobiaceae bacterium]
MIENAADMVGVVDPDGVMRYVSPSSTRVLGYEPAEMVGTSAWAYVLPEDAERMQAALAGLVAEEGRLVTVEYRVRRRDGSVAVLEAVAQNHMAPAGGVAGVVVSARDVTERHRAERERAEKVAVLESSGEGIYGLDADGRCTFMNPAGARLLGYEPHELLGRKLHPIIHHTYPDGSPYAEDECPLYWASVTGQEVSFDDELLWRSDGTSFPAQCSSHPLRMGGEPRGAVVCFSDITQRRAERDALHRREEEFRALVENAPSPIVRIGRDTRYLYVNPAVEHSLGRRARDIVGKTMDEAGLPPEVLDECVAAVRHVFDTGEEASVEYDLETPTGRERHESRFVAELGRDGRVETVLAIVNDLTAVRASEAAMRASEERFRQLAENSRDVFWLRSVHEGRHVYVSPAYEALWERSCATLYRDPESFLEPVHPEDLPRVESAFRGDAAGTEVEFRLRRRDGSLRWICARTFPVRDAEGRIFRVGGVAEDITERKLAGEALRQSEERFRAVFDHATVGIATVGPNGRWLDVNHALCEIVGRTREELLATDFQHITHPDDLAADLALLDRLVAGEIPSYQMEKRYLHSAGHVVWVLLTVSLVRGAAHEPRYFISHVQDITGSKTAADALRDSEVRFRSVVESLAEGVLITDLEDRVLYANPRVEELFGVSVAELLGQPAHEMLMPPGHGAEVRERLARRAAGQSERYELEQVGPDGSLGPVEVYGVPFRDAASRIVGTLGVASDIAERRSAEDALRQSVASYRSLFDSLSEAVSIQDASGRFIEANAAVLRMHGYTREEVLAMPVSALADPHAEPGVSEAAFRRALAGEPQRFERQGRRQNGEAFPVEVALNPGRYFGQDVVIAEARDITERVRSAEALRQSEERLRQAQKMEAVGRLAGGIAHDFNNLLTAITGNAQLLLADMAPDAPGREDLSEIDRAAARAAELTRQLLVFSRKQMVHPEVLDLNAQVAEMDKLLRRLIGEDVKLVTVLDPALAPIKADGGEMGQVLMNLVVNARDAMPRGGTVRVETRNETLTAADARRHPFVVPGPHVLLQVSDDGTGMDDETLSHLFEPFFTTKAQGKGTGLGLSTVYGIVKQSGGAIWVDSEPGRGSTFRIYFPAAGAERATPGETARASAGPRACETVLLVEDEPSVRSLARRILERSGYRVLTASDGPHALSLSAAHDGPVDLLVTDVVMPGMSGRELAERLVPARPDMRVLYMSGYTDDALLQHGVLQEGVAFLEKPFTPATLAAKAAEVLHP